MLQGDQRKEDRHATTNAGLLAVIALGTVACSDVYRKNEKDVDRFIETVGKHSKGKSAKCSARDGSRTCACYEKCARTQDDCHCEDGSEKD